MIWVLFLSVLNSQGLEVNTFMGSYLTEKSCQMAGTSGEGEKEATRLIARYGGPVKVKCIQALRDV